MLSENLNGDGDMFVKHAIEIQFAQHHMTFHYFKAFISCVAYRQTMRLPRVYPERQWSHKYLKARNPITPK